MKIKKFFRKQEENTAPKANVFDGFMGDVKAMALRTLHTPGSGMMAISTEVSATPDKTPLIFVSHINAGSSHLMLMIVALARLVQKAKNPENPAACKCLTCSATYHVATAIESLALNTATIPMEELNPSADEEGGGKDKTPLTNIFHHWGTNTKQ